MPKKSSSNRNTPLKDHFTKLNYDGDLKLLCRLGNNPRYSYVFFNLKKNGDIDIVVQDKGDALKYGTINEAQPASIIGTSNSYRCHPNGIVSIESLKNGEINATVSQATIDVPQFDSLRNLIHTLLQMSDSDIQSESLSNALPIIASILPRPNSTSNTTVPKGRPYNL